MPNDPIIEQLDARMETQLSIKPEEVSLPFVPITTLQGIWGKAENLLSGHNSISSAPGNSSAYIVMSESLKKPHYVERVKVLFTYHSDC